MPKLYIDENNHFDNKISLYIDKYAGRALFDIIWQPIAKSMKALGDDEWETDYELLWHTTESQDFGDFPPAVFNQAYQLIQQNADNNEWLKVDKPYILEAMQADPRFSPSAQVA